MKMYQKGEYDMTAHFSKRLAFELDSKSKVKSVALQTSSSKKATKKLAILTAFHSNVVY